MSDKIIIISSNEIWNNFFGIRDSFKETYLNKENKMNNKLKQAEIPMPDEKQLAVLDRLVRIFGVPCACGDVLHGLHGPFKIYCEGDIENTTDEGFSYCSNYQTLVNYLIGKINGCSVGGLCWIRLATVNNLDRWQLRWFHECVPNHVGVKEGNIYICLEQATDLIEAEFAKEEPEDEDDSHYIIVADVEDGKKYKLVEIID